MKKACVVLMVLAGLFGMLSADAEKIQIRVFDNEAVVKALSLDDVVVKIGSDVIPVKGIASIEKNRRVSKEGKIKKMPLSRNHIFVFSLRNYTEPIAKVIHHFFDEVIGDGESISVLTPYKSYSINRVNPDPKAKKQMAGGLVKMLKQDILNGNREYFKKIQQLKSMTNSRGIGSSAATYERVLQELEVIRQNYHKMIFSFIAKHSQRKGQNIVYYLYEKEFYPFPKEDRNNTDIMNKVLKEFAVSKRESIFDPKKVLEKLKKLNVVFNGIVYKGIITRGIGNIKYNTFEAYEIFRPFAELSAGKFDDSKNPFDAFKGIVDFNKWSHYLFLDGKADSDKKLKIQYKNKKAKLHHRVIF